MLENLFGVMELKLIRKYKAKNYCIGRLYVDGVYFCDTLEDKNRDVDKNGIFNNGEKKVYGKTCIPFGTYKVILSMSSRFKKILPLLLNVPQFDGIRIHSGNTDEDSSGCILVGINDIKGKISKSTITMNSLMTKLSKADDITIEII